MEKHIRNKLNTRELPPSPSSWERISAELGDEKEKDRGTTIWRYAIAASFIGVLFLSIWFFTDQRAGLQPNPSQVVEQNKVQGPTGTIDGKEEHLQQKEVPMTIAQKEVKNDKSKGKTETNIGVQEEKQSQGIALIDDRPMEQEPLESLKDSEKVIANKLEEVLAQVSQMENRGDVSDQEIDSLLMAAQRELLTNEVFSEAGKVDAMALLNEVELELYDDQRNPLFMKLKEGFFKLRTAVADRNN